MRFLFLLFYILITIITITLQEKYYFSRIAQIQYVPTRSSEEISFILNFPNKTRQERGGKVELLFVMRIDEPKFLSVTEKPHWCMSLSNNSILFGILLCS